MPNADATGERGRFARTVFPDGNEPDPRFTLANERTFLAWTRTSLAFLAGGIAFEAFPIDSLDPTLRTGIAVFIIGVGMLIAAGAAVRWVNVERAMRTGKPLPVPAIVPLLSISALVAGAAVLVLFVIG
ncbi:Inner membrane protein YidH [Corynebacterium faecale]|uniref:YidH family protein n=1 Tax=Corynebacterium faecale TaxID=1758466 RepID=UPI0025B5E0FB|nr:YidH family protein [Corynebacterium faecale]WJY90955.1 Inner membrane protein YidH [Corynebacterium faecale]